ncbi:unnamed protein product, partial [Prorocentrum cordatum]
LVVANDTAEDVAELRPRFSRMSNSTQVQSAENVTVGEPAAVDGSDDDLLLGYSDPDDTPQRSSRTAVLIIVCVLLVCAVCGIAFCHGRAEQFFNDDPSGSDQDSCQRRGAKRTRQAEVEVLYPQPTVDWFPNVARHPSFSDALSPIGFQPVSQASLTVKVQPREGLEVPVSAYPAGDSTCTRGTSAAAPGPMGQPPSQACDVGDVVNVFSRGAGRWLQCEVAKVEGARVTVTHAAGQLTRRINLTDPDIRSYFRIASDSIMFLQSLHQASLCMCYLRPSTLLEDIIERIQRGASRDMRFCSYETASTFRTVSGLELTRAIRHHYC